MSAQGPSRSTIMHVIHLDGPGGGPKTVLGHITFYSTVFDVRLVHGGRGMLAKACEDLGVPHTEIPMGEMSSLPLGFVRLAFEFLRHRPSLIILHGQWAALAGGLARLVSPRSKVLYVVQWPAFYTDWDLRRIIRNYLIEYLSLKAAHSVVAISPGNRDEFLRRYPWAEQKIHCIPNSIDLTSLPSVEDTASLRRELGWDGEACHVVCVGRLSTQKRVDWLLRAWKLVEEAGVDAQLWIVGDGEEEARLRELASTLGLRRCTFLGSRPQGWRYIAACDIVAMPSMYEGHANVPIEAMASNRPIVASAVDGVAETLADGKEGRLVPPGDTDAFASALLELIGDPALRKKMGDAGRKRVFDFERALVMRRYLELVFEILALQKSHAPIPR